MTAVKICGIRTPEDALVAAEAGADLLGFVFYPRSPRAVQPQEAQAIVQFLRRRYPQVRCVGVFVGEPVQVVRQVVQECGLHAAQLHGGEPPETVSQLVEEGIPVIKAFRVRERADLEGIAAFRPTLVLLDAYDPWHPGGTGRTFDWRWLNEASLPAPLLLAGGLTPLNVARAIRQVRPWGVDVSSGVERAPGCKDPLKVRRFVAAAKAAS
jgi:phosphoribosylanthranilate isomerase